MILPDYESAQKYAEEQKKQGQFCTFKRVLEGIEVTCEYSFGISPTKQKQRSKISRTGQQRFFEAPKAQLPVTPFEYQQEAMNAVLENLKGTVVLPTGRGKTLVGIGLIEKLHVPTVIVVPTLPLLNQWIDALEAAHISATGVSGTEKKFGRVTVITYQSALLNLGMLGTYKLAIFDEVHHLYAPEFVRILQTIYHKVKYIVGLTASPIERGERGYSTQQSMLPVIYEKSLGYFQSGPTAVPLDIVDVAVTMSPGEAEEYEVYTNTILKASKLIGSPEKWAAVPKDNKLYKLARKALNYLQERRKLLSTMPSKTDEAARIIQQNPGQFIIFTESIPAVVELYNRLMALNIPSVRFDSAMNYTLAEKAMMMRDFKAGRYRVLIGIRTIEEGLDIPDISQAIFLASTRSNRRYIVQRLGRILRYRSGKTAKLWYVYAKDTIEEQNLQTVGNILEY